MDASGGFWLIPASCCSWRGRGHFIEVKTDSGMLSEHQKAVASALLLAGGRVGAVTSVEQLLACLDEWQIPRAGRVRVAA